MFANIDNYYQQQVVMDTTPVLMCIPHNNIVYPLVGDLVVLHVQSLD